MSDKKEQTIGDYYDWVEQRRRKAQAKLDDMIASGASREEIRKQRERVHWAGYTGD